MPQTPPAQEPTSERLRFSTAVLRLLGEELNPSPDQGILELIKNSYDADAKHCSVELKGVHIKGGSIVLKDDGVGMTAEEIRNGWLIVGDSMKSRSETSPSGRLLVGSKGLGRLGALRLGRKVELTTRPKSEPGTQYRMEIDWAAFEHARVVEDVELAVTSEKVPHSSHGTEITISQLPSPWRESDIKRLARAILLLRDPFAKERGFQAVLKAKEFTALETLAQEGYFSESDFHLIAKIDQQGRASAEVLGAGGKKLFVGKHDDIADKKDAPAYKIPALSFQLWEFNLSKKGFAVASQQTTIQGLKAWLAQFGGVRLYHRGVRVMPYGEQKNDWLDMNLKRSQHQELRPSTNNSSGCIRIEDPSGIFQQKTDRLGFIEGDALDTLRTFADNALSWMSGEREKARKLRLQAEAEAVRQHKNAAEKEMDEVIASLPPKEKQKVKKAAENVRSAHEAEMKIKDETAQLYFTLGTVGTTAAAFAHQTKQPLRGIVADAKDLHNYLGNPDELLLFREDSSRAVKRILLEANAIYSFSNVTLRLLEHEKRRSARHSIHQLIDETVELLSPYFEARETSLERDYANEELRVWCPRAAFEAIFTNLLTNALQAFEARAKLAANAGVRRIRVQTRRSGDMAIIRVQDNGPGIEKLALEEIWLPGKTTTEKGTGLGLTIVKDVIEELRGHIEAEAHGELGGASFTITIPLKS
ncbi:MAG TPA: histidine kinase [Verrucomicrobiales bacterium]|nr:histidine kinase [Verrucomicrobiales bacterium]HRJ07496.1 ATP-binding protein [Prosthecobacter sp.]